MYLWNTKALAKELRDGTLTERERMKYFLLFVTVNAVIAELFTYSSEIVSLASVAKSVLIIIGTVAGTYITYRANRAGDDKDFIGRSICLCIPIGFRLAVALMGVVVACMFVYLIIGRDAYDRFLSCTVGLDFVFLCTVIFCFYWRLWHHIAWISGSRGEPVVDSESVLKPALAADYYVQVGEQLVGPCDAAGLKRLLNDGAVAMRTRCVSLSRPGVRSVNDALKKPSLAPPVL